MNDESLDLKESMAVNPSWLASIIKDRQVPGFITVEGPIGVGKTTLAKRLANAFNYETMLEQ
ncbi:deoxynucleoside kinase, partial [Pseudomonadales bacterium]|nr:deoxynucleoside kinase [Pseudomonadales bacterium]